MNKLDEIITDEVSKFSSPLKPEGLQLLLNNVALKFAEHILEEVSKNAKVIMVDCCTNHTPYRGECGNCGNYYNSTIASEEIDKESITSVIKKYL